MNKTARDICTPYLEAVGAIFEKWECGWRLDYTLPEHLGATMTLIDTGGGDIAAVDGVATRLGERDYVMLNMRCLLAAGLPEGRFADMEAWLARANMMVPLGSLMRMDNSIVMKYGLILDTAKPPQLDNLESCFEVFFMQRLLYVDIANSLAVEAIGLDEAIARLG